MATTPPNYGLVSYWDERYAAAPNTCFDWYLTYDALKPLLLAHGALPAAAPADFEVLLPGVGSSSLPARLSADGFVNLTCLDASAVAVGQARARFDAALPEADFSVADATAPGDAMPPGVFDLVLDKALLDALLCGEDAPRRAGAYVAAAHRALKRGGVLALVSFSPDRLPLLRAPGLAWAAADAVTVPKPPLLADGAGGGDAYVLYVLRKA